METKLISNKRYKLTFDVGNSILTYQAIVVYDDGSFVEFIDKNGKTLNYNKNNLVSFEEF